MTTETKQRRDAAARYLTDTEAQNVPPGYKRTEVGLIPQKWSAGSLRSCLKAAPSYGVNAAAVPFDDTLPTYLRITDIGEDNRFRPSPRVSVSSANATRYFLGEGDLVFARTGASVGKSYLYDPKDGPLVFAGFLVRVTPDPSRLQAEFLAYWVQGQRYWDWVASTSARSGQPGINGREYGSLLLPLPPLPEQRAIAEALSDVDGLLGALEALIAKKRAIKQAAMQQLLTGKTRLPGFSGEWKTKRLAEDVSLLSGHHVMARYCNSRGVGTPYLTGPADFPDGRIDQTKFTVKPSTLCRPGDILVTVKGSGSGTLIQADGEYCISRQLMAIRTSCWNARFLFYSLLQNASSIAAASTGLIPGLSRADILEQELPIPSGLSEQAAIATALSDMDAEIAALEARRDKTRAIKQGMMQQLLTGTVRLVKPSPAEVGA